MTKFVTLTMIVQESLSRESPGQPPEPAEILELSGEDDGLEDVDHSRTNVVPITPRVEEPQVVHEIIKSKPVTINTEVIRNFYPRKDDVPGTRVVLKSGVAYVVSEDHGTVLSAIRSA